MTEGDIDPDRSDSAADGAPGGADLDSFRADLRNTDYILGLQAELRTAKERAEREEKLRKQIERQLEWTIERQRLRIRQLERQGFVGFLRRVKRRVSS